MTRTSQGGSILGFLMVGGALALLLIGGVYFVRHNLADSEGGSGHTAQQGESGDEEVSEGSGSEGQGEQSADNDSSNQDDADNEPVSREDQDDTSEQTTDDPLPVAGNSDDNSAPGALPQTGPDDNALMSSLALGLLVALFIRYKRSRNMSISL